MKFGILFIFLVFPGTVFSEGALNFELKAADVIRVTPKRSERWVSGKTPVYEKGKLVGHKNPCGDRWEATFAVSLVLSQDASKRLMQFTEKNVGRDMRLIFEGTSLIKAQISEKIDGGRLLVDMGVNEKAPERMEDLVQRVRAYIRP